MWFQRASLAPWSLCTSISWRGFVFDGKNGEPEPSNGFRYRGNAAVVKYDRFVHPAESSYRTFSRTTNATIRREHCTRSRVKRIETYRLTVSSPDQFFRSEETRRIRPYRRREIPPFAGKNLFPFRRHYSRSEKDKRRTLSCRGRNSRNSSHSWVCSPCVR